MGSVLAVLTSVVLCFVIYVNLQRKVLRPEAPAESLVPAQNADTAAGTELQSGNNEHPLAVNKTEDFFFLLLYDESNFFLHFKLDFVGRKQIERGRARGGIIDDRFEVAFRSNSVNM